MRLGGAPRQSGPSYHRLLAATMEPVHEKGFVVMK